MGVPTSDVGYTSATTGRRDHEFHKGHVLAVEKNKFYLQYFSERISLVHMNRSLHPKSFGNFVYPSSGNADIYKSYMDSGFNGRRHCKRNNIHVWY
jgi:hypothetical protein